MAKSEGRTNHTQVGPSHEIRSRTPKLAHRASETHESLASRLDFLIDVRPEVEARVQGDAEVAGFCLPRKFDPIDGEMGDGFDGRGLREEHGHRL